MNINSNYGIMSTGQNKNLYGIRRKNPDNGLDAVSSPLASEMKLAGYKESIAFTGMVPDMQGKCVIPSSMPQAKADIKDVSVTVAGGDMTQIKADAFFVPEFNSCVSEGGVGYAIKKGGAAEGLRAYADYLKEHGRLAWGDVVATESGGGNSKYLLHGVTAGAKDDEQFKVALDATYNALKAAQDKGMKSVVFPAIGTGIIGCLTNTESANAVLAGINKFAQEGGKMDVSVVVYSVGQGFRDFENVLKSKSYETAVPQRGTKVFDRQAFKDEMSGKIRPIETDPTTDVVPAEVDTGMVTSNHTTQESDKITDVVPAEIDTRMVTTHNTLPEPEDCTIINYDDDPNHIPTLASFKRYLKGRYNYDNIPIVHYLVNRHPEYIERLLSYENEDGSKLFNEFNLLYDILAPNARTIFLTPDKLFAVMDNPEERELFLDKKHGFFERGRLYWALKYPLGSTIIRHPDLFSLSEVVDRTSVAKALAERKYDDPKLKEAGFRALKNHPEVVDKLAVIKDEYGRPIFDSRSIADFLCNSEGNMNDASFNNDLEAILSSPEEMSSISDWMDRGFGLWKRMFF